MPHTCNLAKCNPSSDRCPRERSPMPQNSDCTQILRHSGKDLSTISECMCETQRTKLLLSVSAYSNFVGFPPKHTNINSESNCFCKWLEGKYLKVRLPVRLKTPWCLRTAAISFVLKQGFRQICPHFFKIKRIWIVKFIGGNTAILLSPRRNFCPSRKAFFLRKERLSSNRIRMSETLKWLLISDFNANLSNTKQNHQNFYRRSLLLCLNENSALVREKAKVIQHLEHTHHGGPVGLRCPIQ